MTYLIDKKTRLRILKKNNKFKYQFQLLNMKVNKHLLYITLFLCLYLAYRYFVICNKNEDITDEEMKNVKYKNKKSYQIKNSSKLSENNYLEKYMKMPTKVRPVPNNIINNF